MKFKMAHSNINVIDAEKSKKFYEQALGLKEVRRKENKNFVLVYMDDGESDYLLELTQLFDHPQKYDLGENEIHFAFKTADFDKAYMLHKDMGCICFENKDMGIYFIEDPDGYWLEIVPS